MLRLPLISEPGHLKSEDHYLGMVNVPSPDSLGIGGSRACACEPLIILSFRISTFVQVSSKAREISLTTLRNDDQ